MQPTFSLIYTSVRAALIEPVIKEWLRKARKPEAIEIILTVDLNDQKSQDVAKSLETPSDRLIPSYHWFVQASEPFNCVKGWNLAAAKSTGKVLVQVTDDMVPPDAWDDKLLALEPKNWIDRETVIHVEDGYVHDIMVLAIMSRVRYERFGYFFYPDYESLFCLPPETPIYMANQTFKAIGRVKAGDTVVGTERRFGRRGAGKMTREFLHPAKVLQVTRRHAEIVKVTLQSGKVLRCTPDHLWAYYADTRKYAVVNGVYKKQDGHYVRVRGRLGGMLYGSPKETRRLVHVVNVPPEPPKEFARDIGWLAGIYDGEGSFPVLSQSLSANPDVCAEIERVLSKLGFKFTAANYAQYEKFTQRTFYTLGGRNEYLRFLAWLKPVRSGTKQVEKRLMTSRFGSPDRIIKVEADGFGPVVCLKTSTGNFVADGYLSHNCDTELTEVAYRDGVVIVAKHLLFEHRHPDAHKRTRDTVDAVHASQERWTRGEILFNHRKGKGFPIDVGPKATQETKNAGPQPLKYCVYIQATRDDFCLYEVCKRMMEEGVNVFFFSVPDEYWSGRRTPPEHIAQVSAIAGCVRKEGGNIEVMVHKVKSYRFAGDTRLRVETRVRNDAVAYIRKKGFEHILIVDGDELWRRGALAVITRVLNEWHPTSINCRMIPVIGLPGYPIDGATDVAVVYVNAKVPFQECRTPIGEQFRIQMPLVIHFTGTRRTMEEIVTKHKDSGHWDDPEYLFQEWLDKVLPNVKPGFQHTWPNGQKGLHMYQKYQIWNSVRNWMADEISEIPQALWPYLAISANNSGEKERLPRSNS